MTISKFARAKLKITMGAGSFAAILAVSIALLISGKSSQVQASIEQPQYIEIPTEASLSDSAAPQPLRYASFGIPLTPARNVEAVPIGLSANDEVNLTADQAELVHALDSYLKAHNESAILTSGKRTPESQLQIIKEKISDLGAVKRFKSLANATVHDVKVWFPAWRYLVARRVPVNAPARVPGKRVRTSAHLQGRAIDIISDDLDHLRSVIAGFMRSPYAKESDMRIGGILREPGCLHLTVG